MTHNVRPPLPQHQHQHHHDLAKTPSPKNKTPTQPIWFGGAATSLAALFTHPLDQTKYRLQVLSSRPPLLRAVYAFAARDGILSLWSGLSASVLRQSTYSTARFALYNFFAGKVERIISTSKSESKFEVEVGSRGSGGGKSRVSAPATIACAGLAGGIAGVVGNPAEVVLVRMCADGAKPPAQRFAYKNAVDAVVRIAREDGIRTFGRGLAPNIVRSVLMNISQIASYTEAKSRLLAAPRFGLKDDIRTHIVASLIAGTVATTVCAPADMLKSRVQSLSRTQGQQQQSIVRFLVQTVKNEGLMVLMKGWTPAWLRLAPNTILTFVFMEKLQAFVNRR